MSTNSRVVDACVKKCLWLLDSGMLENAHKAIQETDVLPDAYAGAILLEARRLYPSPTGEGKAEETLENLLQQKLRHRTDGILDKEQITKQLADELTWDMSAEHFALVRRLLAATQTPTNKPLVQAGRVQLDRLTELLDRSEWDTEAEKELRTTLFDDNASPRPPAAELLHGCRSCAGWCFRQPTSRHSRPAWRSVTRARHSFAGSW
jgi:hypothetical protein